MRLEEYNLPNWDKPKIKESLDIGDITIALLKPLDIQILQTPREGIQNLLAYHKRDRTIKWIAELSMEVPIYQVYDSIQYENNILKAYSGSMLCAIDIETGKILHEQFSY